MPPTIETTAIRNVTPIVTPITVKKLFSFCTRIVFERETTAWKNGSTRVWKERGEWRGEGELRLSSLATRLYGRMKSKVTARTAYMPETRRERLAAFVGRDQAVAKHDDAARVRRDVRLVRDHDDRLSARRRDSRTRA